MEQIIIQDEVIDFGVASNRNRDRDRDRDRDREGIFDPQSRDFGGVSDPSDGSVFNF